MLDLDELARLAEKATPGEWRSEVWYTTNQRNVDAGRLWVCNVGEPGGAYEPSIVADAAYIAAVNPATVLSLIARLRAAEADRERLRETLQNLVDASDNGEWHNGDDCEVENRTADCGLCGALLVARAALEAHS